MLYYHDNTLYIHYLTCTGKHLLGRGASRLNNKTNTLSSAPLSGYSQGVASGLSLLIGGGRMRDGRAVWPPRRPDSAPPLGVPPEADDGPGAGCAHWASA
eukprot:3692480-Amphidinium_carterae.1